MKCIVGGDPAPKVSWTKNGTHLANTSNTVTISHMTFDDAGQYGCSAENRAGRVNKTIWIDVTGKIERFSNGVKAKTKVITLAADMNNKTNQSELEANTSESYQAPENANKSRLVLVLLLIG